MEDSLLKWAQAFFDFPAPLARTQGVKSHLMIGVGGDDRLVDDVV